MKSEHRSVQKWQSTHNQLGITEFRALPFRGDRLDMTVK